MESYGVRPSRTRVGSFEFLLMFADTDVLGKSSLEEGERRLFLPDALLSEGGLYRTGPREFSSEHLPQQNTGTGTHRHLQRLSQSVSVLL